MTVGAIDRIRRVLSSAGVLLISACSDGVVDPGSGPWIGTWVQVNFLAVDDNGVWDEDDPTGIGFVQSISADEWVLTDNYGNGCSISFSYTIRKENRFSRRAVSAGNRCPPGVPLDRLEDTGHFEFSNDHRFMIEWYDLEPGDEIVAFKWLAR